jgi:hypothetical protein
MIPVVQGGSMDVPLAARHAKVEHLVLNLFLAEILIVHNQIVYVMVIHLLVIRVDVPVVVP